MADYPSSLPLPLVADYAVQTVMGVSSVGFERGNKRQRRTSSRERHTFSLSFVFTTAQLWAWQSWANQSGYEWHLMNLESAYSALSDTGARLVPHYVRYTSDITIEALGNGYLRVLVAAELDLDRAPDGRITPTGNWYVSGTPAAPATNTITAGTPASPASNTITAGTPTQPAA
jgi:hypothetical protein